MATNLNAPKFMDYLEQTLKIYNDRNDNRFEVTREDNKIRARGKFGEHTMRAIFTLTKNNRNAYFYTYLPFDVETESDALNMAKACTVVNRVISGVKMTYNMEKDVTFEQVVSLRGGFDTALAVRAFMTYLKLLDEYIPPVIDLFVEKISFSQFKSIVEK